MGKEKRKPKSAKDTTYTDKPPKKNSAKKDNIYNNINLAKLRTDKGKRK